MYLSIKLVHIISSTILFGTGLGSVYYMLMAYRSGDMGIITATNRFVVLADYCFTTPTVIIQLVTGLILLHLVGQPWTSVWSLSVLTLYAFVGACWLPVVFIQISLRNRAQSLNELDETYHKQMRWWMMLGVLAFPAVLVLFAFMVFKPFWYVA